MAFLGNNNLLLIRLVFLFLIFFSKCLLLSVRILLEIIVFVYLLVIIVPVSFFKLLYVHISD